MTSPGDFQPTTEPAKVASPCIKVCVLTPERICLGCGRSMDEIAAWGSSSEDRKREIVEQARVRRAELGIGDRAD